MNWNMILYIVLNTAFVFLFAPLLISLIKKVKALSSGSPRDTAAADLLPVIQTIQERDNLFRQLFIYSTHQPLSEYRLLLVASIFVPIVFIPAQESGFGNIILFLYLMVCARSSWRFQAWMPAAPSAAWEVAEMTIASIIEPTTLMQGAPHRFILKTTDIPQMFGTVLNGSILQYLPLLLVACSLFIILIVRPPAGG